MSIPRLSDPPKISEGCFLTASKIREMTERITGIPSRTEFLLMGELIVYTGGKAKTSVSQELLKFVAKMSNFNVDLQAFTRLGIDTDYRARCNQCGDIQKLDYQEMITSTGELESVLAKFCSQHKHDGNDVVETQGRRFRAAIREPSNS